MIGGAATLGLALLVGRDSLGLSLPLIDDALGGVDLGWWVPWLKLLFTVVALGSGFLGGEVTPLFVVGATLGAVAAGPLGIPQAALASIGFVSVFGAAARVHLTAAVMAAELFGWQALLPALFVTWVARAVAGRRGLYDVEAASPTAAR
jgi:H+/Cl- antiporter ClcA